MNGMPKNFMPIFWAVATAMILSYLIIRILIPVFMPHFGFNFAPKKIGNAAGGGDAGKVTIIEAPKLNANSNEAVTEESGSTAVQILPAVPRVVTASSYMISDLISGRVVAQKDSERAVPIASITKIVTAMVARTMMDQNERIEMTGDILNTEGNSGGFRLGEKYRVSELLYPLLMVSSNDAAEGLAAGYPYGRHQFIKAMNDWASSIGAYNTYFADPSGLSSANVSSAKDISIIMRWIATHEPDLLAIMHTKTKTIRIHTWTNPTMLLNMSAFQGGKNGYTSEAGQTGVSIFAADYTSVNSPAYVIVVLKSFDRNTDELLLLEKTK